MDTASDVPRGDAVAVGVMRRFTGGRTIRTQCWWALAGVLLACVGMWWLLIHADVPEPAWFRASTPDEWMHVDIKEVRDQLLRMRDKNNRVVSPTHWGLDCIGAPNIRIYAPLVLLWEPDSGWVTVRDPKIDVDHRYDEVTQHESSWMCTPRNGTVVQRKSFQRVRVAYLDENGTSSVRSWKGASAHCIQHWVRVFEGHWPCAPNPKDIRVITDATRLPNTLHWI